MRSQLFSEWSIHLIRLTKQLWPFRRGYDLPNHLGAFAAKHGFIKPVWFEFQPGLRMQLNIRELIHETILFEGIWDPQLTEFIKTHLNPGDVFIDMGAHSGYFTLLAARGVTSSGKVLSVEPNPIVFEQLVKNVEASNLSNVIPEQVACGDSKGQLVLYIHDDSNSSMSSLSHANVQDAICVEVECKTLDSLIEKHQLDRVDLIKIDVEGAELCVLRGALKMLELCRPTVVLELDSTLLKGFGATCEDVIALMDRFNYNVRPLGGHSNYVCEPKT